MSTSLQVTIPNAAPVLVEGTSKDGKPFRFHKHAALVRMPNGDVVACSILAPKERGESKPYAPGTYELDASSFYVRNGELTFAPKLRPVAGGTK